MTEPHIYIVPAEIWEAANIRVEMDEILAKFPKLAEYDPDSYCCEGCGWTDVYEDLGPEAADAWERLNDLHFMIAEEYREEALAELGYLTEDALGDCDE